MQITTVKYSTICHFILLLIFPFSVFVDMYNGYCHHYLSGTPLFPSLYKGGLVAFCVIYCFIKPWSPFFKSLLVVLFLYAIAFLYWIVSVSSFNVADELNYFIKFSYPYFVLAFLFQCQQYIQIDKFITLLTYYGVTAATSIILLFFLGLGVSSYGEIDAAYGFGTKGFFTAGNDIGLTLLMTNCLLCYLYVINHKFTYLLKIILVTIGTIMLGTMAGIGGSLLIWGILAYFIVFVSRDLFSIRQKLVIACIVIALLIYILSVVLDILAEDKYMLQRFDVLLSGDSRTGLRETANQVFENFNVAQWLLGMGFSGFGRAVALNNNMDGYRLTEMDFHDVVGYYGLLVGGAVLLFSFYVLWLAVKTYLKIKSVLAFWIIILLCLFIGHGYLAGHAYTSTQSALLFVGIAFVLLIRRMQIKNMST